MCFCVQPDIGSWNTAQVTICMVCFVRFCVQPRHWELEHRASDSYGIYVYSASAFNQDIGSWNTAQVTDMNICFSYASAFNHDISSWTGSAATTAQTNMFLDATAFQAKFTCDDAVTGPASSCDTIEEHLELPLLLLRLLLRLLRLLLLFRLLLLHPSFISSWMACKRTGTLPIFRLSMTVRR